MIGITIRVSADLLEIYHNSVALFFIKIRKIIAYH